MDINKIIETSKQLYQDIKCIKEACKRAVKKYTSRACMYNGKKMCFWTLYLKLRKEGLENAAQEAKKYLL